LREKEREREREEGEGEREGGSTFEGKLLKEQ